MLSTGPDLRFVASAAPAAGVFRLPMPPSMAIPPGRAMV